MNRLLRDRRGAGAIEFAIAAPVFFAMLLGCLETGHTLYVQATLDGEVQKAARDLGLENASAAARRKAITDRVERNVQQIIKTGDVSVTTYAYHDYSDARDREEPYNDANHNGQCDHKETYVDSNNNNQWDADSGIDGAGGAKDVILLTATVTYPRLGISRFWIWGPNVTLTSKTMLRNQPSTDQGAAPERNCPW